MIKAAIRVKRGGKIRLMVKVVTVRPYPKILRLADCQVLVGQGMAAVYLLAVETPVGKTFLRAPNGA